MIAYCLFCETQKCAFIAHVIEHCWGIRCISPKIIQRKWVKGIVQEVHHSMLPGYIFLYPEEPLERLFHVPGIIRVLGNKELQNEDLAFAIMLLEHNGIIGTIRLIEEGDHCIIADPIWGKMEGKVIKIDRGRKRCCVKFVFDVVPRTVWLGYDLVQMIETEQNTMGVPETKD